MHRSLFRLAIFIPGAFYLWDFFFSDTVLSVSGGMTVVAGLISIITAFAVGLGLINVFGVHLESVARRRLGWKQSLIVFVSFTVTMILCIQGSTADRRLQVHEESFAGRLADAENSPDEQERSATVRAIQSDREQLLRAYRFNGRRFFVMHVYKPLVGSAMALLGFYITYAAYRAFRLHSRDSAVMLLTATIVIIGRDPIGGWLTSPFEASEKWWLSWISLPEWATFTVNQVSSAFQRGLQFGLSIAVLAVSLRIWLGHERGLIDPPEAGELQ